jgi:hypothetical protein
LKIGKKDERFAGSPHAQRVLIFREGDMDKKVNLAKALAGIAPERSRKGT